MKTFSFIKNQKIFFGIVAVVFIIGIASFFINGFNVDIDFVGGTEITYDINKTVTKDDEAAIEAAVKEAIGSENFSSIRVSGENVIIRTKVIDKNDNSADISNTITEKMAVLYPNAVLDANSSETELTFTLADAEFDQTNIETALAEIDAEGLAVTASGATVTIAFESSSAVSEMRSNITDAVTLLYDNTSELSASAEAKVTEIFPGAVLSEDSTEDRKIYTLTTAETDEEGNAVLYTWTEEDVTALQTAITDAGLTAVTVDMYETELHVNIDGTSPVEWLSTDSVSAEVSAGLRDSAILATVVAVVLMLVYIAIRFQLSSAFAAVVCLAHDLFVMIVAYSLFDIPVNSTIIAALLTILGYSINATIIVFDRIRENDKKFTDGEGFGVKVDDGIRHTIMRSVNTTLTTLFTIGMIYLLGVTSIKNFALPLIVGIVAGLFSSVCLAGPLWRLFKKLGRKIRNK